MTSLTPTLTSSTPCVMSFPVAVLSRKRSSPAGRPPPGKTLKLSDDPDELQRQGDLLHNMAQEMRRAKDKKQMEEADSAVITLISGRLSGMDLAEKRNKLQFEEVVRDLCAICVQHVDRVDGNVGILQAQCACKNKAMHFKCMYEFVQNAASEAEAKTCPTCRSQWSLKFDDLKIKIEDFFCCASGGSSEWSILHRDIRDIVKSSKETFGDITQNLDCVILLDLMIKKLGNLKKCYDRTASRIEQRDLHRSPFQSPGESQPLVRTYRRPAGMHHPHSHSDSDTEEDP